MPEQENIKIPPGYTRIKDYEQEVTPETRQRVRWSRDQMAYLFDRGNPEYQKFLKCCKEDSKALSKSLQKTIQERIRQGTWKAKKKVWTLYRSRPSSKKEWEKIGFMIRPPYFRSTITTRARRKNRWQRRDDALDFVLHFDENHLLQIVRNWSPKRPYKRTPEEAWPFHTRNAFQQAVTDALREKQSFLQQNYGNWDVIAESIADILEANVDTIQEKPPAPKSQNHHHDQSIGF